MAYRSISDAPEPVSPVGLSDSGMQFPDIPIPVEWRPQERILQPVTLTHPSAQSSGNGPFHDTTGTCLHVQIAEQLRRSVSPTSFKGPMSGTSKGERQGLPIVLVLVDDANVREFERRGCSCSPLSPNAPTHSSGGRCLCRLGSLLRKVSNGAKKCLAKRLPGKASSTISVSQSNSFDSFDSQAPLASTPPSSSTHECPVLQTSDDTREQHSELSGTPRAVFELPCPAWELDALSHTNQSGCTAKTQEQEVDDFPQVEVETWQTPPPLPVKSPRRLSSRQSRVTYFTLPRTSSLISNTSSSTGGRMSLVSMPSVSTFSECKDLPSTPGTSVLDEGTVASPVSYVDDDCDIPPWENEASLQKLQSSSVQAASTETWSLEITDPWATETAMSSAISLPNSTDQHLRLGPPLTDDMAIGYAPWQESVQNPADRRHQNTLMSRGFVENPTIDWGTSIKTLNPFIDPLGASPAQHPPIVYLKACGERGSPDEVGGNQGFCKPQIGGQHHSGNFPSPSPALRRVKTSFIPKRGPYTGSEVDQSVVRHFPESAASQLPSVRNLERTPIISLRRRGRILQGPTSCIPCNYYPDGAESARRKKVRKHETSDKHRRKMKQPVLGKITCPGHNEDGTLCGGQFSCGRLDNFKQHFGKSHPDEDFGDISDALHAAWSDEADVVVLNHSGDGEMDWEVDNDDQ